MKYSVLSTTALSGLLLFAATVASADTTLTFFTGNDPTVVAVSEALARGFEAGHPGVTVEVEVGPGGAERDNLVKSRLATGSMSDVFVYNSGSLFQAINPAQTLADLSGEAWQADVLPLFQQAVTAPDGTVRGAPFQNIMGAGMIYNRNIYAELGLSIPKTWDEFMANNAKIKEAGKAPVIQTYKDTWTSQIILLGDFFNVVAAHPDWAQQYTENVAHYADTPEALAGFQHMKEIHDADYLNADYGAATFIDGLRMVAMGEGAHYPMLSFAIAVVAGVFPDNLGDIGYFAIPGESADSNGLTIGLPSGLYVSADGPNVDLAKEFIAYTLSADGCEIQKTVALPIGPFAISTCTLPDGLPPAVGDVNAYVDAGATAPALEFLSPVKGPSLEQLTVEVGSGMRSPEEAAELYDRDVAKQALQLGLPGWN